MKLPASETFERHDLFDLDAAGTRAARDDLKLTHLENFMASVAAMQSMVGGDNLRSYLKALIANGSFEIVSPQTGQTLRNGSSLILTDKTVVYSFPDEPTLMIGVGDLSQGYPICAALLTDRRLLLGLCGTSWGFSERHLPELFKLIHDTGWEPGPATAKLTLVLGDANFAHYAWNQLSALEEVVQDEVPDGIVMVATQQPLGPIREIFPELAKWPLSYRPDTGVLALNAPGALFAPVGGRFMNSRLIERLLAFAEKHISQEGQTLLHALSAVEGPVLWMSVRTRNRTATNQHELLTALGRRFLAIEPTGAILIDGFSSAFDMDEYPSYHQEKNQSILREDLAVAEALRTAIESGNTPGAGTTPPRVHVAVGLTITDSILLSRHASIYFCHHGTVQHKIGWFSAVPGVIHCNRSVLAIAPSAWVAAQSEVAIPPSYLPPHLVHDAELPPDSYVQFENLLRQENYTIADIPAVVDLFLDHAAAAKITGVSKSRAGPNLFRSARYFWQRLSRSVARQRTL